MKSQICYILLILSVLSCQQNSNSVPKSVTGLIDNDNPPQPNEVAPPPPQPDRLQKAEIDQNAPEPEQNQPKKQPSNENLSPIERKLIKTGDVRFKTKDLKKTKATILQAVNQVKGYISEESQSGYGEMMEERLSVRVPSQYFDTLLNLLGSQAEYFDFKNIHTQDVTQEYIDVSARIKTKKELEERYRQILKSAGNVKDLMEVERELNNVREEIESSEGRLKYLSNQVTFSTLNITYYRESSTEDYASRGFFSRLKEALRDGWQLTQNLILGIISLWPLILLGLVFYYLFKKYKYKFSFKRKE
jgi:hypothetical protein